MPHETNVADMLRSDLADTRQKWLKAARPDPEDSGQRQESDFLAPLNHEGEQLGFHAPYATLAGLGWR